MSEAANDALNVDYTQDSTVKKAVDAIKKLYEADPSCQLVPIGTHGFLIRGADHEVGYDAVLSQAHGDVAYVSRELRPHVMRTWAALILFAEFIRVLGHEHGADASAKAKQALLELLSRKDEQAESATP